MNLLLKPVRSSLGKKYAMAVTGLLLIGFVVAHMSGNLLIYLGPDALNSYAQALKARPALLWAARGGLLAVFLVHLFLAFRLTRQNYAARPTAYVYEETLQATWASRHMMLTGLVLLLFIAYHLAHFTLGVVHPADVQVVNGEVIDLRQEKNYLDLAEIRRGGGKDYVAEPSADYGKLNKLKEVDARHDVYSMVVSGFRVWWISVTYLLAMAFLGLHLWHGGSSFLQSLGLNGFGYARVIGAIGPVLAVVVVAGNCSIPISVMLGIVR
ncbi:MAG: succinate dehydrogenase cytochrome b subunit [Gemmataceae bacterium]